MSTWYPFLSEVDERTFSVPATSVYGAKLLMNMLEVLGGKV